MEEKVHRLVDHMQIHHAYMCNARYGPVLSPVLLVVGFALLIVGIIILPIPVPGWLHISAALGIPSSVHPPTRRLNIWLAAKLDAFYAWYVRHYVAMKATLFLLLMIFMIAVMGSVHYSMAPDTWLYIDVSS